MTTSKSPVASDASPEAIEAVTNASNLIVPGMNETGVLAGIDAAAIDRIASSVLSAASGTTTPDTALPSVPPPDPIPGAITSGATIAVLQIPGASMPWDR